MLIQILAKHVRGMGMIETSIYPKFIMYTALVQSSTGGSFFFLLYGRDPTMQTLEALLHSRSPSMGGQTELATGLNSEWRSGQNSISVY